MSPQQVLQPFQVDAQRFRDLAGAGRSRVTVFLRCTTSSFVFKRVAFIPSSRWILYGRVSPRAAGRFRFPVSSSVSPHGHLHLLVALALRPGLEARGVEQRDAAARFSALAPHVEAVVDAPARGGGKAGWDGVRGVIIFDVNVKGGRWASAEGEKKVVACGAPRERRQQRCRVDPLSSCNSHAIALRVHQGVAPQRHPCRAPASCVSGARALWWWLAAAIEQGGTFWGIVGEVFGGQERG